jgi:hypothetical protein
MKKFLLSEKFRLELHWEEATYEREGMCKLKGAYFSGPALSSAAKINSNEFINLDFCNQYYILARKVYVAKFEWGEVKYNKDGTVTLEDVILSNNVALNIVPKFSSTDYIVIDTTGHEEGQHHYNLVYNAYLIKETGDLYNFSL